MHALYGKWETIALFQSITTHGKLNENQEFSTEKFGNHLAL